jgi:hypothetical protein
VTFREKALYHQIHPAKLAIDVLAAVVSLYFLWRHQLVIGLVTHFAPPIAASALLLRFGNFERQKTGVFGRYIAWHMTRAVEALRLGGDLVMAIGAWFRSPALIIGGLMIVLAAWISGPLRRRRTGP